MYNPNEPRDESGKWTAFDASHALLEAASGKENPFKNVDATERALANVPIFEKMQLAVDTLPKEKVDYRSIKGIGDLSIYVNNPEALNSPHLRSAKKIYEDIKNGKPLLHTPSINTDNQLLDGQNRIVAQLAAGIKNVDVAKVGQDFYSTSLEHRIAVAYHKAKNDGSNTKFKKLVEDAIK